MLLLNDKNKIFGKVEGFKKSEISLNEKINL